LGALSGMVNTAFTFRAAQWTVLRQLKGLPQRKRQIDVSFSEDVRWIADL